MVAKEIVCQQGIPVLDVEYHLRVAQEHNVKVEVSPRSSSSVPIFSQVRVSSDSLSTDTRCFEMVCFFFLILCLLLC